MLHRSALPPAPPPALPRARTGLRARRRLLGAVGPALLAAVVLTAPPAAAAGPGPALTTATPDTPADAGCTDQQVTVVVDLTDLGGEIEVGCGDIPATGTEVLLDAGFVETRDPSGFICAINDLPDPCPTTFTGSFWSYWHGEPGGQWQAYEEGSDTAAPVAGESEGWRYNDGSQGPGLAPAAVVTADDAAPTAEAGEPADESPSTAPSEATATPDTTEPVAEGSVDQDESSGPSPAAIAGIALVVVLALAAAITAARRRGAAARGDGPAGQD